MATLTTSRIVAAAAALAASLTLTVAGLAPASAASKVYDGPDVASYQHPGTSGTHCGKPISWTKVKHAGKDFAFVKATEGTSYTNPCFAGDYAALSAAGLVRGSYHFARPALPIVSTATAQAEYYAGVIGDVATKKTLPPVLDFETSGGLSQPQLITWAQVFLLKLRALTGRTPMLYTYPNFWSSTIGDPSAFGRFPLWMAAYGVSQAPTADFWQYTSGAHVKGIRGNVDMSKFVGALGRAWGTLSDGTAATPWAAAAPAAPVAVGASAHSESVTVHWLPGDAGTSRITRYRVTASPGGQTVTVGGTSSSAGFDNLTRGTTYRFTVKATNSVGTSVRSAASNAVVPATPTVLSSHVSDSTITIGSRVAVTARLRRADTGAVVPGQKVLVYRRAHPSGQWHQAQSLVTDDAGRISTTVAPRRTDDFEVVFPGTRGVSRSQSFVTVGVRPAVTAALSPTSVVKGGRVVLSGTVSPFFRRQPVTAQLLTGSGWKDLTAGRVSHRGTYSLRIHVTKRSMTTYRVEAARGHGRYRGLSPRQQLTIS